MLNQLDDYPIHQTQEPLARPATSDRNFYDRYFFNGYTTSDDLYFGAALGVYPNRRVMDASFSVSRGGWQRTVHASRLAPGERSETRVGPISVEVEEPMRRLAVRIDENEFGVQGELRFVAACEAFEEPRMTRRDGERAIMDTTRFTQFGNWEGTLTVAGESLELDVAETQGVRDRSWGVRPVGEPEAGAPGAEPQFFWLWAPVRFEDVCVLAASNEDALGRPQHRHAALFPTFSSQVDAADSERGVEHFAGVAHRVRWQAGTRRVASAELTLVSHEGERRVLALEPLCHFQMLGLGYLSPEWGHGVWKGEEAVGGEAWELAKLDPMDPRHLHVQQLVRARMGEREGIGVLEQLALGRHAPSGFKSLIDPAT